MENHVEMVSMTAQELAEFNKFKSEKEKREKAENRKQEREAYRQLVDETIEQCFPTLFELSEKLKAEKKKVYEAFSQALTMKSEIFETKDDQRSHKFTNKESNKRITLGQYETDGYDDTVNEGISKVKDFLSSLAQDDNSKLLVKQILRLLAKDKKGDLKASRVMQLRKMAEESNNETFCEGIKIIEEAYRPEVSKFFIRAERKTEIGSWENIPLGITEA